MSPGFFYNLSKVYKFNEINGHTYEEYIKNWKKRYNILDIDYISVVVKKDNILYKSRLNKKGYFNAEGKIKLPKGMISKGFYERAWDGDYNSLPNLY